MKYSGPNKTIINCRLILFCLLLIVSVSSPCSDTSNFKTQAYAESYYAFDFNQPQGRKQSFLYSHNRHNQVGINLLLLKGSYLNKNTRANIAAHLGDYVTDNYVQEPMMLRYISEANIGFAIDEQQNWWFDMGVFPSYIGFESAVGIENLTLSRSLMAENSPYYMTGATITHQHPNEKLYFMLMISNGWQRMVPVRGNNLPSFGSQVQYIANANTTLNWSTFGGTDYPDSLRRMRYFNNLFWKQKWTDRWNMVTGLDMGIEQSAYQSSKFNSWWTFSIIQQYEINKYWKLAARIEHFSDANNVIILSPNQEEVNLTGYSINLDYHANKNATFRIEARYMNNPNPLLKSGTLLSKTESLSLMTSLCFRI